MIQTNDLFFPASLKNLPIWGLWRIERNEKGKLTKVPYSSNYNGRASSTNPDSWSTFDHVWNKYITSLGEYQGVALFINKDYHLVFIDLDDCILEDGSLSDIAWEILEAFEGEYIERSQSGSGLHIITSGAIPKNFRNDSVHVEMYGDHQFCALTGDALSPGEPSDKQSVIDEIYKRYKTPDKVKKAVRTQIWTLQRDDQWIIAHASRRGQFAGLYSGDVSSYQSHSEADLALCLILAFWTDCDPDQMDRIFRSSGLYRLKWERDNYRNGTIGKAIDGCQETLSEYQNRMDTERGIRLDRELRENWDC